MMRAPLPVSWYPLYLASSPKRALIANAGSTGTRAPSIPGGITIMGLGRTVLPANCGSHSRSASNISEAMSRICFNVSATADRVGAIDCYSHR